MHLYCCYQYLICRYLTRNLVSIDSKARWFEELLHPIPNIFVVEISNKVVGYFYFTSWRDGRKALNKVSELSVYLDRNNRRKGLGEKIVKFSVEHSRALGVKSLLAIILDINMGSLKLLEKTGWKKVGHLENIAEFEDRICGQYIMEKKLEAI